jgi:hypothetical protein
MARTSRQTLKAKAATAWPIGAKGTAVPFFLVTVFEVIGASLFARCLRDI